jgi:hypothetical protein
MNKHKQRILAAGLMALGLGWITQEAQATAPTTDAILVSVTPNVTYGVAITSATGENGYNFGPVDLAATTISTMSITVTSSGTVSEFFAMSVVDITGSNPWTAMTTDATPNTIDQYELQGHFTDTSTPAPVDTAFSVTDGVNGVISAHPPVNGSGHYSEGSSALTPGTAKYLWLKLKMPKTVTAPDARKLSLLITGQSS